MKALTIIKAEDGSLVMNYTNIETSAEQIDLMHEAMYLISTTMLMNPMGAEEIARKLKGEPWAIT